MDLDVIPTGRTTATVILSQDQVDTLRGAPGRGRVPLAITYDGQVFRTSISVYRGQWMMVVNQAMRDGGLTPPGTYAVDIVMDQSERVVDVPDDLSAAIRAAGLTEAWEGLSFTNRKELVRGVVEAKKPETRARRIEKAVATLGG
jgi:Bacteriocin-protection, YdeI or OmpD-Associated/Domain of unknown function (DUF1905)